jgi:hypothetical protein
MICETLPLSTLQHYLTRKDEEGMGAEEEKAKKVPNGGISLN